jgi:hypothetical protein
MTKTPKTQNLLVLAESISDEKKAVCYEHLVPADPSGLDVLMILYHRSPENFLEEWDERIGERPANTFIVGVHDRTQSSTTNGESAILEEAENLHQLSVNPNDITGLGMQLNNALTEFEKSDNKLVVCFDSITALLQFIDLENAYKFLHMLTGKLHAADAYAHFHVDPEAHETQAIRQLQTTFDDRIDVTHAEQKSKQKT